MRCSRSPGNGKRKQNEACCSLFIFIADKSSMKPNFLVIGAMKCGTTQLYHLLRQHPDVFMSDLKEPNMFADSIDERV